MPDLPFLVFELPTHYGWLSILPPVSAIILAITTRRVISSLLFGVFVGVVLVQLSPIQWASDGSLSISERAQFAWSTFTSAVEQTAEGHLWKSLTDVDHLRVFVFTMLMGAMIAVIHRSGGMQGVVNLLAPFARGRRGGQLVTWLMGLVIFIDDYANSLLLGNTMRPVTDRLRISREKLAYLVDSTAAPVSGLALISTWIAGEIGFIEEGFESVKQSVDGFAVFVETIPYRFYVLLALLMVPLVAILGRDWGPMLRAEQRTLADGPPDADEPATDAPENPRAINAILPIVLTVGATVALLYATGKQSLRDDALSYGVEMPSLPEVSSVEDGDESLWRHWMGVIGAGNSYVALLYGSFSGLGMAFLLVVPQRLMTIKQFQSSTLKGASHVLGALGILWLAWALSGIAGGDADYAMPSHGGLGTGSFLAGLLGDNVAIQLMPTIIFLLSSIVAFSTGTSWGTMALLMPIVITTLAKMATLDPSDPVMLATVGSVLAGAIFGDHCSPISDTTVLSSQASGCNHVAHVWTQMPYALLVALVSVVFGTLPVGFGWPVWLLLPIGLVVLVVVQRLVGRVPTPAT